MKRRAFTLLEVCIVLSIALMVAALVIWNYRHHLSERQLDGSYREVSALLKMARETAIAQGGGIQVVFSNSNQETLVDELDMAHGNATLHHYQSPDGIQAANGGATAFTLSYLANGALQGANGSTTQITFSSNAVSDTHQAHIDNSTGGLTLGP